MKNKNLITDKSKALHKADVSGSISVSMGRTERYRQIYSNSNFFIGGDYYVLKDDGESLTITRCGLEVPKNAQMFVKGKTGGWFQCVSELPIKKIEFDAEESNCDEVRIYYR